MLSAEHIESPYDVVKEGQAIEVKVTDIDRMGRVNLATPAAIAAKPEGRPPRPERSSHDRGERRPYGREGSDRPHGREGSDRPPRGGDRRPPRRG
jgi:polyribonucleotide nucleotidyltransferase